MRLWFSTAPFDTGDIALARANVKHRLVAYSPVRVETIAEWQANPNRYVLKRFPKEKSPMTERLVLMLDSGAYSAFSMGLKIDLNEYAAFILKHPKAFDVVASLDVIPPMAAGGGGVSTAAQEKAAQEGWENWLELTKLLKPAGIKPIHTFHKGENVKWLKKLVDNCEYLGLGGIRFGTADNRVKWLDEIMPYLTDDKGRPLRKFHGFAATSVELMTCYPWYSVDSTSWLLAGRYGDCIIPLNGNVLNPLHVTFSKKSPSITKYGKAFNSYSPLERKAIAAHLATKEIVPRMLEENYCETCGTAFEKEVDEGQVELIDGKIVKCCSELAPNLAYMRRDEVNIHYFLDFERSWEEPRPWKRETSQTGFGL